MRRGRAGPCSHYSVNLIWAQLSKDTPHRIRHKTVEDQTPQQQKCSIIKTKKGDYFTSISISKFRPPGFKRITLITLTSTHYSYQHYKHLNWQLRNERIFNDRYLSNEKNKPKHNLNLIYFIYIWGNFTFKTISPTFLSNWGMSMINHSIKIPYLAYGEITLCDSCQIYPGAAICSAKHIKPHPDIRPDSWLTPLACPFHFPMVLDVTTRTITKY